MDAIRILRRQKSSWKLRQTIARLQKLRSPKRRRLKICKVKNPNKGTVHPNKGTVNEIKRKIQQARTVSFLVGQQVIKPSLSTKEIVALLGEESSGTIVDSGTKAHISQVESDFVSIDKTRKCYIKGVGGLKTAYWGKLKPNRIHRDAFGIYCRDLPVQRLFSTAQLNADGWTITLAPEVKTMNREDESIILTESESGLPYLKDIGFDISKIYTEPAAHAGYLSLDQPEPKGGDKDPPKGGAEDPDFEEDDLECIEIGDEALPYNEESHKTRKQKSAKERFLEHCRKGHFQDKHRDGRKLGCVACMVSKKRKSSHAKIRPEKYKVKPLVLFAADFFGPIPVSFRGARFGMIFVCDTCKYTIAKPITGKYEAPQVLEQVVRDVREKCGPDAAKRFIFAGIRSDNEPAFRSEAWTNTCRKLAVHEGHSVPWCPQQNGVVERTIGTLKSALRACMHRVDQRLWCYGLEHVALCFNERVNKLGKKPADEIKEVSENPLFKMRGTDRVQSHGKRFGCLAFAEIRPRKSGLNPQRFAGAYVGLSSKNSAWLVTRYEDNKVKIFETRDCIFRECTLVTDLQKLSAEEGRSITGLAGNSLVNVDDRRKNEQSSMPENTSGSKVEKSTTIDEVKGTEPDSEYTKFHISHEDSHNEVESHQYGKVDPPNQRGSEKRASTGVLESTLENDPKRMKIEPHIWADPNKSDVLLGPVHKKRGRPAGSKDKKERTRRWKKKPPSMENSISAMLVEIDQHCAENQLFSLEEDETPVESPAIEIFLSNASESDNVTLDGPSQISPKIAMDQDNPEYPMWLEASNLERTKLLAYKCWRRLTPEELIDWKAGKVRAVPTACIFTKKRNGKFKCRCVVLGNRRRADSNPDLYAGTVSHPANRMVMIEGASRKWTIAPYDVGNAFIRAEMPKEHRVAILLPKDWRDANDTGVRMLERAMYGLPISPRIWGLQYAKDLRKLGFQEAQMHSGVWIKKDEEGQITHILTVYVDDCILVSRTKKESKQMLKILHETHPLSEIEAAESKDPDGSVVKTWDILGCDVSYNQSKGELNFSMEKYLRRLLQEFGMQNCKSSDTPGFDIHMLYNEKEAKCEFPIRKLVGSLQWASVCCRLDLTQSVNALSRVAHKPTHKGVIAAAKRVLRYIKGTLSLGIHYSPEEEKRFGTVYKDLRHHTENEGKTNILDEGFHPVQSFADASFASTVEFKSVSGAMVFYKGTPVIWRSSVQTLAAGSTFESEWVAQSDLLLISREANALERFLRGCSELEMEPTKMGPLWCDSRSAVLTARKSNISDVARRSRHVAIRLSALMAEKGRIAFCPTNLMRADGLTKGTAKRHVYDMLFRSPSPAEAIQSYLIFKM